MKEDHPAETGAAPRPEDWHLLRFALRESIHRPAVGEIAQRATIARQEKVRRTVGVVLTAAVIAAIPIGTAFIGSPTGPTTGSPTANSATAGLTPVPDTPDTPADSAASAGSPAKATETAPRPTELTAVGPGIGGRVAGTPTPTPAPPPPVTVWDAQFADADHGYALLDRCSAATCATRLAITSDGRNWTERATPYGPVAPAGGMDLGGVSLSVLGPDRVVVRSVIGVHQAWLSTDAGRSWRATSTDIGSPSTGLEDGSELENVCVTTFGPCSALLTVRTPTGALTTVADAPTENVIGLQQLSTRSWLVWGLDKPGGRKLTTYRTVDAGRTWKAVAAATMPSNVFNVALSGVGTARLVATVIGELPDVKNGLLAISSSSDGGLTWQPTWTAARKLEPRSSSGAPVLTTTNSLTVLTEDQTCYGSTDLGRHFRPATGCDTGSWTTQTHGVYVRLDGTSVRFSTDGVHWNAYRP